MKILAFQLFRRARLVDKHARAMLGLSTEAAVEYLTAVLEDECRRLTALDVDCDDELDRYIAEIGAAYHALRRKRGAL
jgi:hypothetical protein